MPDFKISHTTFLILTRMEDDLRVGLFSAVAGNM